MLQTCFGEEPISDMGREEGPDGETGLGRRCFRAGSPLAWVRGGTSLENTKHTHTRTHTLLQNTQLSSTEEKWSASVEGVERQEIFSMSFIWRTIQEGLPFFLFCSGPSFHRCGR